MKNMNLNNKILHVHITEFVEQKYAKNLNHDIQLHMFPYGHGKINKV